MFWEGRASFAKVVRCSGHSKEASKPGTEHLKVEQREKARSKVVEDATGTVAPEALRKVGSPSLGLSK